MKQRLTLSLSFFALLCFLTVFSGCDKEDNTPLQIEDADGNIYNTTEIGTQIWMSSNLRTTKYNDGADITLITDNTEWDITNINGEIPAYCWYNNDEATYAMKYGALYNFYAVDTEKLCPEGWHVPTEAEWVTLETFLGGADVAGGKMKEEGTTNWLNENSISNNNYGFSARGSGWREPNNGVFLGDKESAGWWSSTVSEEFSEAAVAKYMWHDDVVLHTGLGLNFSAGQSIRCIQD